MNDNFKIEVISHWNQTLGIKEEWNNVNSKSGIPHPFTTYEWFNCCYRAYCTSNSESVILVREKGNNNLRAIFPGMVLHVKIGGIQFNCYTYAGNGHTPRYGIN